MPRQVNFCRSTVAGFPAIVADLPVRLLGEPVDHRKPQAGALSGRLGGEEKDRTRASTSGGMPQPVSMTQIAAYWPMARSRSRAASSSTHALAVSIVSPAAVRHRVSGIDAEIEKGVLQLIRIAEARPLASGENRFELDGGADGPADQLFHPRHEPVRVLPLLARAAAGASTRAAGASTTQRATSRPLRR